MKRQNYFFDGWFYWYNGWICGNKPTDLNTKINNKSIISLSKTTNL